MSEESIFNLSPAEKLQLVEDLWNDITSEPDQIPIYNWQMEEVANRKQRLLKAPMEGVAWQEMIKRIRERRGS